MSTPTINTYVSDMLALERHVLAPLEHQAKDDAVARYQAASTAIAEAVTSARARVQALDRLLDALGGHAGSGVKSGVATALGSIASVAGDVRQTEVSKYIRDDYSALALASAAYTMLHTAALGFKSSEAAQIAQDGLQSVASSVIQFSKCLPTTVLAELRETGLAVDDSVVTKAEHDVSQVWQQAERAT